MLIEAERLALTASASLLWYMTALLMSQPLHFSNYAGRPLKLLCTASGSTRLLKGGHRGMAYFREKAHKSKLQFKAALIQLGASVDTVSDDILRLIATTDLFLKKTTRAMFRVVVNAENTRRR